MSDPALCDAFYDQLAPWYHLIYPDWEASMRRQAASIDAVLHDFQRRPTVDIVDVACGIGTQAIGLAQLGYRLAVADMRNAYVRHGGGFDAVLCGDNSITHLLTDQDIGRALGQFLQCLAPGGACLVSTRDYDLEQATERQIKPYGLREAER